MDRLSHALPIANTAVAPLTDHAFIRVSGTAAASFLQGQLTCDIKHLKSTSSLAAHCNTKGRVRALYRVFQQGADFYLRCPKSLLNRALSFLQFYARFSKVSLTPIENPVGFGLVLPKTETAALPFPALDLNGVFHTDDGYTVLRVPGNTHWDRYEIYRIADTTEDGLKTWLLSLPDLPLPWALTDILAGIPDIFPETSEQFLPHYIGLPQLGAISFNKGCYIGQEIIARMEYRSKQQKYHLALVNIDIDSPDNIPKPGETLADKLSTCVCVAIGPLAAGRLCAYALIQTPLPIHDAD